MPKSFVVDLKINVSGNYTKRIKEVEQQTKRTQRRMEGLRNTASKMKSQFTSGLIGAAAIGGIANFAQKWNTGLAKISTLTKGTMKDVEARFGASFKAIAIQTGQDTGTILEGAYQALSAGVKPEQLVGFIKRSAIIATAGFTDVKTSVDGMTSVMNAWGLKDVKKIGDIMINTQNLGKTTFGEIAQSIGLVAPIAASAGISFEQITSAIAGMTKVGVNTRVSVTALKGLLNSITKQSPEATRALKKLGITMNIDTLKEKGIAGSMKFLMDNIKKFTKDGPKQKKILSSIIRDQRALLAATALGKGEGFKTFNKNMALAKKNTDSTKKAFDKMGGTLAFKRLKIQMKILAISIGKVLIPVLTPIVKTIGKIGDKVAKWAQRNPKLVKTLAKVALTIVAIKLAVGALGFVIGGFSAVATVLSGVLGGVALAVKGVSIAMAFLAANPVVLIAAAIAALIVGVVLLVKHWDKVKDSAKAAFAAMQEAVTAPGKSYGKAKDAISSVLTSTGLVSAFGSDFGKIVHKSLQEGKTTNLAKDAKNSGGKGTLNNTNNVSVIVNTKGNANPAQIGKATAAEIEKKFSAQNLKNKNNFNRLAGVTQ